MSPCATKIPYISLAYISLYDVNPSSGDAPFD